MPQLFGALSSSVGGRRNGLEAIAEAIAPPPPSTVRLSQARPPRGTRGTPLEDAQLVRGALQGDRDAEAAIWRRYLPLVRARLTRTMGSRDAEDHAQEVFARLFEYLHELRDPEALRSFLIGITLRVAGTELRRRRCRWWLTLSATGELPEPIASEDHGEARAVAAQIAAVLGQLSPLSYRFFELRFIEERELTDVATAMNVSLATAKRHLARVTARVQAMADRELGRSAAP